MFGFNPIFISPNKGKALMVNVLPAISLLSTFSIFHLVDIFLNSINPSNTCSLMNLMSISVSVLIA